MNDMHQYPEKLLYLLQEKDFSQLNEEEMALVSQYMDAEEYTGLRKSHSLLSNSVKPVPASLIPGKSSKEALLAALRENQRPTVVRKLVSAKIPAWQAAAAILILAALIRFLPQKHVPSAAVATIVDTVKVLNTEIKKEMVHDTVYIVKERTQQAKSEETTPAVNIHENKVTPDEPVASNSGINILGLEQKKDFDRQGKSLADDSLTDRFGFVKM